MTKREIWIRNNREVFRKASKKWSLNNPEKRMLNCSKQNARKKGQEHSITIDDIKIPEICPVFGVAFEKQGVFVPSLDRIDNTKGYVPGNVQVISKLANTMKFSATQDQLVSFARWVLKEETR